MTRLDVNHMVEDAEECLNMMWASPNITGTDMDAVKQRGYTIVSL